MAGQGEGGSIKEEVKTQFVTREGVYKLLTLSEYSRPNRVAFNGVSNTPVKTSFVTHKETPATVGDKICFNVGKELYVYNYKGVRKVSFVAVVPRLMNALFYALVSKTDCLFRLIY